MKNQNMDQQTKINIFNQAKKLFVSSSKDYYHDLYLPIYKFDPIPEPKNTQFYINNTIDFYCKHHKEFDKTYLIDLENSFNQIIEKDRLILIHGKVIYYELYRVLWLIESTQNTLKTIEKKDYGKNLFAQIHQDQREVKREVQYYKKQLVKAKRPLPSKSLKKEPRLKWYFLQMYHYDKKLFNVFFSSFLLCDLEKVADIYTLSEDELEIVMDALNYLMNQKTTASAVIKSLGILLYTVARYYLKIKHEKAKTLAVEIVQYVFEDVEALNDEEFNASVYIRSVVSGIPIFGASRRKEVLNKKEIDFLRKKLIKFERRLDPKFKYDVTAFNEMIQIYLEYPHATFLQKYPAEFFRKNSKYSHLSK